MASDRIFGLIALLGVGLLSAGTGTVAAQDQNKLYILNTSTADPYTTVQQSGFQDRIVAEVFQRLGLKGRVEHYNASARALQRSQRVVDHRSKGPAKGLKNVDSVVGQWCLESQLPYFVLLCSGC